MEQNIIDYSESFSEAIAAQGKGKDVLILIKLDKDQRRKRFDGKIGDFELIHRWLSQECQSQNDEAWACVRGSEITLWQRKEINVDHINKLRTGEVSLFDIFSIV